MLDGIVEIVQHFVHHRYTIFARTIKHCIVGVAQSLFIIGHIAKATHQLGILHGAQEPRYSQPMFLGFAVQVGTVDAIDEHVDDAHIAEIPTRC